MEGIGIFLESSLIHGLSYISTTRKYARLFWILVVIAGFVGASLLIKESFDSWTESPVKTTIETLSISEIKLPKVTVCPPKDTYTDLNYDLIMTENKSLTEDMRDELFAYALEVFIEDTFSQSDWTKLHEEDRFYNWYHGYTKIKSPFSDDEGLNIEIHTSATTGVVTTKHYKEQFMPELVERKLLYTVYVYLPESVMGNENVTLHFKVEKISMTRLAEGRWDTLDMGENTLNSDQSIAYTNFTPPGEFWRSNQLSRDVSLEDVETQRLDLMPGFRFRWWYTGAEATPDKTFEDDEISKQFVR